MKILSGADRALIFGDAPLSIAAQLRQRGRRRHPHMPQFHKATFTADENAPKHLGRRRHKLMKHVDPTPKMIERAKSRRLKYMHSAARPRAPQ